MTTFQRQYHHLQSGKHLCVFLSNVAFWSSSVAYILNPAYLDQAETIPEHCFYFSKGNEREDLMGFVISVSFVSIS